MGGAVAAIVQIASAVSAVGSVVSSFSKPKAPSAPAPAPVTQPTGQPSQDLPAEAEEKARRATLARARSRTPTILTSATGVGDAGSTKKTLLGG
jgi:hypothetical protein